MSQWGSQAVEKCGGYALRKVIAAFGNDVAWDPKTRTAYFYLLRTEGVLTENVDDIAVLIRNGEIQWSIADGILKIGNDEFVAPNGWTTPITGRRDCFDSASKIFR